MSSGTGLGETLSAVLAGGQPSAVALVSPEDEQALTYADLAGRVDSMARLLSGAGVRRGDRVAMALPNGPECVEVLLAIMSLGAAAAPLNSAYTESEFAFYLGDIAPRVLVTLPGQPRAAISAAAAAGAGPGPDQPRRRPGQPGSRRRGGAPGGPGRARPAGRHRDRAAHQRDDQPAQAGAAAPAQPDGLGPHGRRALRPRPGRRVVRRDAAVPHPRPDRVDVRRAQRGRHGRRPAPVHPAAVLAAGPRLPGHLAVSRADDAHR